MHALDDIGNPDAPVGSRDWVQACNMRAQEDVSDAKTRVTKMRISLLTLQKPEYLEQLRDRTGRPFVTFDAYCNAPQPWGLGFPAEVAHAVIEEKDGDRRIGALVSEHQERMARAVPAKTRAEAGAAGGRGHKAGSHDYQLCQDRGADYIASRIKRDRPDIAEAVERGEYASMRQAGIAAGFVKPRKAVTLGDPTRLASRIMQEGDDYARAVRAGLEQLLEGVIG